MPIERPARAALHRGEHRVVVDGSLFALTFPDFSSAQEFADLCNRKARLRSECRDTRTITLTINGTPRTFTPSEFSAFLRGTLV